MSQVLRPTGKCFDDAIDIMMDLLNAGWPADTLWIVHAICEPPATTPIVGPPVFSHAWVEFRGSVLFKGILDGQLGMFQAIPQEFYDHWGARDLTKYSIDQVRKLNAKHETTGPWEPRYQALCRDRRKSAGAAK